MTELLSPLLGVAALGVAVWAAIQSRGASREANDLQERLVALESARERDRLAAAKRARVVAFVRTIGRSTKLFLRNEGEGPARAIQVFFDGQPMSEHPVAVSGDSPPTALGSQGEVNVLIAPTHGTPIRALVTVAWEDDSGPGRWESDLKLV